MHGNALGGILLGLLLALSGHGAAPGQSLPTTCDFSGFQKPCAVEGGTYRAMVPEGDGPFPAMVYLYGSGGRSAEIANHPIFNAAVVERGYALIVPAARAMEYGPGQFNTGWNLRHEPSGNRDDALFVQRVIDDAARRFRLDRGRILLVGQSRGAFLVWEIACHEPETAAAYAVHAGGYLGRMPATCARPVRFLQTHGLTDDLVPYAGPPPVSAGVPMTPIEDSLAVMARTDDCADEPVEAGNHLGLARMRWTGCMTGSSLDLMLHGGGHTMPIEWFRTVVDWFEETPEARPELVPRTVASGTRLEGRFKSLPAGGTLLARPGPADEAATTGGPQRLRPPSPADAPATKQLSQ